jgi:hypothetical protein
MGFKASQFGLRQRPLIALNSGPNSNLRQGASDPCPAEGAESGDKDRLIQRTFHPDYQMPALAGHKTGGKTRIPLQ